MNSKSLFYACAVGIVGTASIGTSLHYLAEYEKAHLANVELVKYTQSGCTPQRIGQAVALLLDAGRVVCARFDHGIPKDVWLNYMAKRGRKS